MKQPVDTVPHLLMLHKLATVGLLDASLHSCDEAGLIFEHPGNCVFHQLLGILAVGKGQLLESRFNIGREMYFHAFKIRENQAGGQPQQKAYTLPKYAGVGTAGGGVLRESWRSPKSHVLWHP